MYDILSAILAINPSAEVTVNAEDLNQITWLAGTAVISKADIETKILELKAVYDAQEYARNRRIEYDLLNQFELIGEDSINGTTNHKEAILEIKAKYPKI